MRHGLEDVEKRMRSCNFAQPKSMTCSNILRMKRFDSPEFEAFGPLHSRQNSPQEGDGEFGCLWLVTYPRWRLSRNVLQPSTPWTATVFYLEIAALATEFRKSISNSGWSSFATRCTACGRQNSTCSGVSRTNAWVNTPKRCFQILPATDSTCSGSGWLRDMNHSLEFNGILNNSSTSPMRRCNAVVVPPDPNLDQRAPRLCDLMNLHR